MIEALLFDFDGLILDTETAVYEAWRADYLAHGHELPLDLYSGCVGSDFNGFDPKAHLESLVGISIDWTELDLNRSKTAHEGVLPLAPFPGVVDLLDEAIAEGIPCVVASSSPRSWVEGHLDRLGLLDRFAATRCLDDVAAPKPAPDLFLLAASSVDVGPDRALVLEDSLNGLRAAQAAGIDCVIVPNRITGHLDFEGAAAVLDSLAGIELEKLREFKGLPRGIIP